MNDENISDNLYKVELISGYNSDSNIDYNCIKSRPIISTKKLKNKNSIINQSYQKKYQDIDYLKEILKIVHEATTKNINKSTYYPNIEFIFYKLSNLPNSNILPEKLEIYIKYCLSENFLQRSENNKWCYKLGTNANNIISNFQNYNPNQNDTIIKLKTRCNELEKQCNIMSIILDHHNLKNLYLKTNSESYDIDNLL